MNETNEDGSTKVDVQDQESTAVSRILNVAADSGVMRMSVTLNKGQWHDLITIWQDMSPYMRNDWNDTTQFGGYQEPMSKVIESVEGDLKEADGPHSEPLTCLLTAGMKNALIAFLFPYLSEQAGLAHNPAPVQKFGANMVVPDNADETPNSL